jgi:ParB family chromosome partitioning protein
MHLTTTPLATLLAPKGNPRKTLDAGLIAGLANSIRVDGLLQNLVVAPEGEGKYRVISGKRRYLALQLLKKEGTIDGDYEVPVDIKDGLAAEDAKRLATVENVQREQLHPMDEADAYAELLQSGGTVDAITEKTGLTERLVKRRLALATLIPDVKKALRKGEIGLGLAEALTLGSREQQKAVLQSIDSDGPPDPLDVRDMFLERKPALSIAIFPKENYTGTVTTDLFASEETTYFDDVDQFLVLQNQAVEALAEEHRKTAAWVDLHRLYTVPWWQYREAAEGEPWGIVINLHPSGSVEIRERLVRHAVEERVVENTRETPLAPRPAKERPVFGSQLIRYVAAEKSAAVQAALLRNPRQAREVAALVLLLGFRLDFGVRLTLHPCHLGPDYRSQRSHREIDAVTDSLAARLDIVAEAGNPESGVKRLVAGRGASLLREAIGQLTDEELDGLIILLPVLCFGQEDPDHLDSGDSLFNLVANSLGVEMRDWWIPDETFLGMLRREQLHAIAAEAGATEKLQGLADRRKEEVVTELSRYFAEASEAEAVEVPASRWAPGFFRFPASKRLTEQSEP